ncbi:hypothetical protein VitviT2T_017165 [Vitis vinifera]|uniref:Uncharacterized protein n=1 Tax=Vitis vinifera TaxID=29760 RepID=A0ABY9CU51_VITVI|nr:hypothetical protein VitviT2T_017165 [Vitis vinifera]
MVVQNRRNRKMNQTTINDAYKKEARERACMIITRWMYEATIPFNAVTYPSFQPMIEVIGQYGVGMKGPTLHELRSGSPEMLANLHGSPIESGNSDRSSGMDDESNNREVNSNLEVPNANAGHANALYASADVDMNGASLEDQIEPTGPVSKYGTGANLTTVEDVQNSFNATQPRLCGSSLRELDSIGHNELKPFQNQQWTYSVLKHLKLEHTKAVWYSEISTRFSDDSSSLFDFSFIEKTPSGIDQPGTHHMQHQQAQQLMIVLPNCWKRGPFRQVAQFSLVHY